MLFSFTVVQGHDMKRCRCNQLTPAVLQFFLRMSSFLVKAMKNKGKTVYQLFVNLKSLNLHGRRKKVVYSFGAFHYSSSAFYAYLLGSYHFLTCFFFLDSIINCKVWRAANVTRVPGPKMALQLFVSCKRQS